MTLGTNLSHDLKYHHNGRSVFLGYKQIHTLVKLSLITVCPQVTAIENNGGVDGYS